MTTLIREITVKETIIDCLEDPSVISRSTSHFREFKSLHKLYEKQIEEKAQQWKEEVVPTFYTASIEDEDLKTFQAAEWVEANFIDKITERQIQQCVEGQWKRKWNGEQLYMIDQETSGVCIHMHIVDAKSRMCTLRRKYCSALRKTG